MRTLQIIIFAFIIWMFISFIIWMLIPHGQSMRVLQCAGFANSKCHQLQREFAAKEKP